MPGIKGKTNNPFGRPKGDDTAAAAIRSAIKTKDWKGMAIALRGVVLMEDPPGSGNFIPNPLTDGREKAAAYKTLADRAFGLPTQKQIVEQMRTIPYIPELAQKIEDNPQALTSLIDAIENPCGR
jgi:hypothetical protein